MKHHGEIEIAVCITTDLCFYIQHFDLPMMGLFAYMSDQVFCLFFHACYRTHFSHPGGISMLSSLGSLLVSPPFESHPVGHFLSKWKRKRQNIES